MGKKIVDIFMGKKIVSKSHMTLCLLKYTAPIALIIEAIDDCQSRNLHDETIKLALVKKMVIALKHH